MGCRRFAWLSTGRRRLAWRSVNVKSRKVLAMRSWSVGATMHSLLAQLSGSLAM